MEWVELPGLLSKDAPLVTREHKLALIVGFSLVLVVGVLISDHFSKARNAAVTTDLTEGSADKFGGGTGGLAYPSAPHAKDHLIGPAASPMASGGGPSRLPDAMPPAITPPPRSTDIVMGAPPPGSAPTTTAAKPATTETVPEALKPYFEPAVRTTPTTFETHAVPPAPAGTLPNTLPPNANPPLTAPQSPAGTKFSTGTMTRHEVAEGDTIFRITRDAYGDGHLWTKLKAYNKGRIGDDGTIHEGATLTLPPKDVLLGQAVMPDQAGAKPSPVTAAPPVAPAGPPSPKATAALSADNVYVVQKGDILGEVSKKLLGSARRWTEIASLNNLDDPDNLTEGMKLKIPAR